MKKLSGHGPAFTSGGKSDSHKGAPLGKDLGAKTEAAATATVNGSMNYNSNDTCKTVGKK